MYRRISLCFVLLVLVACGSQPTPEETTSSEPERESTDIPPTATPTLAPTPTPTPIPGIEEPVAAGDLMVKVGCAMTISPEEVPGAFTIRPDSPDDGLLSLHVEVVEGEYDVRNFDVSVTDEADRESGRIMSSGSEYLNWVFIVAKASQSFTLNLPGGQTVSLDSLLADQCRSAGTLVYATRDSSDEDADYEIYTMNAFGLDQVQLTDNEESDGSPSWSPDGSKIAFVSSRDGDSEIFVMDADGSNQTQLTHNDTYDIDPVWSPDGTQIAYTLINQEGDCVWYKDCPWEIYIMNADGSDQTRLTDSEGSEMGPSWSPDGTQIVFSTMRHASDPSECAISYDCNSEIYIINSDGSNETRLTDSETSESYPQWSPDGSQILFESRAKTDDIYYDESLYVMSPDGSNLTELTDNGQSPSWSPDGMKIAFVSDREGDDNIYVMNADGSQQIQLTDHPKYDWNPSWSPDGTQIVFTSDRDDPDTECYICRFEIYIMNADGSGERRVTQQLNGTIPNWKP